MSNKVWSLFKVIIAILCIIMIIFTCVKYGNKIFDASESVEKFQEDSVKIIEDDITYNISRFRLQTLYDNIHYNEDLDSL